LATNDYTSVSELSGYRVTQEQIARMYTRYRFAADLCVGRDVLEVACGSGQGLGLLAKRAKSVVGGDFDPAIVALAQKHYGDRIPVKQMNAHAIPFADQSLDAVILFEAIYYLKDPLLFFRECKRVLRKGGILVIGSANKEWPGFNPSPFSHTYFSAQELSGRLNNEGFDVEIFADCPVQRDGWQKKAVGWIKEVAVRFHLMPKTMKGKEILKRIFMGRLQPLPSELKEGMLVYSSPTPLPIGVPVNDFKVLFAVGRKSE
jgi:SAM-dependent methyltransferase